MGRVDVHREPDLHASPSLGSSGTPSRTELSRQNGRGARRNTRQQSSGQGPILGFMLLAGALAVPFPGLVLICLIGLLPTIAASGLISGPFKRQGIQTILLFNSCGVLPQIIRLFEEGRGWRAALEILSDIYAWLMMYAAASMGWLVLSAAVPLALYIKQTMVNDRRRKLQAMTQGIVDEWGKEVLPQDSAIDQLDKPS